MTREQDFERQLAEWLVEGPNTAPAEVVDRALGQTDGRRQWRGAWRVLVLPLARGGVRIPAYRMARLGALAAMLAGILLASVVISVPFFGGGPGATPSSSPSPPPGWAPEVVGNAPRVVGGTATAVVTSAVLGGSVVRSMDLESDDLPIAGHATQELTVLAAEGDAQRLSGTMRLENAWGSWEGPVDIVRYPSGEEHEYASLTGSGAYDGFIYLHTVRHAIAEAERSVEGAIWPDEPLAPLDPQVLP